VIKPTLRGAEALWEELPPNLRGALWILLAAAVLTIMGALVKHTGKDVPAFQMVFIRSLIAVALVVPFMLRTGLSVFRTKRPGIHVFRILMGTTGMFCVFYALSHLPLAETVAIVFSRPLFAVWLAILFLSEKVGWRRIAAALTGFAGVLILVRPGTEVFDPASLVAVMAAVTAGSVAVIIKKMSTTEAAVPLSVEQWIYLVLIGVTGVSGMAALTKGFSTGDTSFVTPFDYSRLIYATLIGLFIFGEHPDHWSVVGALIIVASGYYIARRELAATRARLRARHAEAHADPKDTNP
jgi:drug/metabolite transporter (DMT)-like permease